LCNDSGIGIEPRYEFQGSSSAICWNSLFAKVGFNNSKFCFSRDFGFDRGTRQITQMQQLHSVLQLLWDENAVCQLQDLSNAAILQGNGRVLNPW